MGSVRKYVALTGDADQLKKVLECADSRAFRRSGDGEHSPRKPPSWLLSPVDAHRWKLLVPGIASHTSEIFIDWSMRLPDGSNLLDEQHHRFLTFFKHSIIALRDSPAGRRVATSTFVADFSIAKSIVTWAYQNDDLYDPDRCGLSRLDADAIADMLRVLATSGRSALAGDIEATFGKLLKAVPLSDSERAGISSPYKLSASVRRKIERWLSDNGLYESERNFRRVHRARVCRLIDAPSLSAFSPLVRAFFRQFEPEIESRYPGGVTPSSNLMSDRPEHYFRRRKVEPGNGRASAARFLRVWRNWVGLRYLFPQDLPELGTHSIEPALRALRTISPTAGHTPWMPMPVALVYLREAMRFVEYDGRKIINAFVAAHCEIIAKRVFVSAGDDQVARVAKVDQRNQIASRALIRRRTSFTIEGWQAGNASSSMVVRGVSAAGKAAGLVDAMCLLIAAVAIVVASTKPIRMHEFLMLRKDCLHRGPDGGYWLEHVQLKRVTEERREWISRPVPYVAAKALRMLIHASKECEKHLDTPRLRWGDVGNAFDLPILNYSGNSGVRPLTREMLEKYLMAFGDFIGESIDWRGERWYVRMHQFRKSFLISYFWTVRYPGLDAARWIAGHTDASHLYAYIEGNFPGDELPGIEAAYAREQLFAFESGESNPELGQVERLHASVCRDFGVKSVTAISAVILDQWLKEAFSSGKYMISVTNLTCGGAADIRITVLMKEGDSNADKRREGKLDACSRGAKQR